MAPKRNLIIDIVYDPDEAGHGPPLLDLVLVHGLNGDPVKTWSHSASGVFWPGDLLPQKQPRTRVMTFGYNGDIYKNQSIAGIRGNARALLTRLRDERDEVDDGRPIVFLAHGLGGLIVKQALRFAENEATYKPITAATRGLLLYGTPHLGADSGRWLSIAQSFASLSLGRPSPLVDALARDSPDVEAICEDFRHLARRYAIASFYETEAWPGTQAAIVDKSSALMMLDHEEQVPLEANHVEMVRFEGARDPHFVMTYKMIQRISKGVRTALLPGGSAMEAPTAGIPTVGGSMSGGTGTGGSASGETAYGGAAFGGPAVGGGITTMNWTQYYVVGPR